MMNFRLNELENLLVFRGILQDPLLQVLFSDVSEAQKISELIKKAEEASLEGNVLSEWVLRLIAEDENSFSMMSEKSAGNLGFSLQQAVLHDLDILLIHIFQRKLYDTLDTVKIIIKSAFRCYKKRC